MPVFLGLLNSERSSLLNCTFPCCHKQVAVFGKLLYRDHGSDHFALLKLQEVYYGFTSGLPRALRDFIDFLPVNPAKVCKEQDIVVS